MITIRRGSRIYKLLSILAYVGEYPMQSLHYLGSTTGWTNYILQLCHQQEFKIPESNQVLTGRLLQISGSDEYRGVYLYKGGLPILKQAIPEAYEYYTARYPNYFHSARLREVERVHRLAEVVAFCERANIKTCQYELPELQLRQRKTIVPDEPCFYMSWEIKNADDDGGKRTMFSRIAGMIFYPGGWYAVYHSRNAVMNWNGGGELKARNYMATVANYNACYTEVKKGILLGEDYTLAKRTLAYLDSIKPTETKFSKIFEYLHFIPTNDFGVRLLKILVTPDWREKLLDLLFDYEDRKKNTNKIESDAVENGVYVFSFLDSDIVRLNRMYTTLKSDKTIKMEVICFHEQGKFLRELLGSSVKLRFVDLNEIEEGIYADWSDESE